MTFSNPAEVAKTRMQLQGELAKGGGQKVYNNAFDVIAKTWRNEGVRGLQRGLSTAVRVVSPVWNPIDVFPSTHTRHDQTLPNRVINKLSFFDRFC